MFVQYFLALHLGSLEPLLGFLVKSPMRAPLSILKIDPYDTDAKTLLIQFQFSRNHAIYRH